MYIATHLTALERTKPSKPVRYLLHYNKLPKQERILDFGCGKGFDVAFLKSLGFHVHGYDPYKEFGFNKVHGKFFCVLMTYVINHLTHSQSMPVLAKAWSLLRPEGTLHISVRSPQEIRTLAEKNNANRYLEKTFSSEIYQHDHRLFRIIPGLDLKTFDKIDEWKFFSSKEFFLWSIRKKG